MHKREFVRQKKNVGGSPPRKLPPTLEILLPMLLMPSPYTMPFTEHYFKGFLVSACILVGKELC
jgi:hypothetical protein